MCGSESDKLVLAVIEGVELNVCTECLKLGRKKEIPKAKHQYRKKTPDFEERVVVHAGKLIKEEREKRGMRQIDLAKMLQIKDSFLHHIETGDMSLSLSLAKQIESTLNINLVKKFRHVASEQESNSTSGLTFADLLKKK